MIKKLFSKNLFCMKISSSKDKIEFKFPYLVSNHKNFVLRNNLNFLSIGWDQHENGMSGKLLIPFLGSQLTNILFLCENMPGKYPLYENPKNICGKMKKTIDLYCSENKIEVDYRNFEYPKQICFKNNFHDCLNTNDIKILQTDIKGFNNVVENVEHRLNDWITRFSFLITTLIISNVYLKIDTRKKEKNKKELIENIDLIMEKIK